MLKMLEPYLLTFIPIFVAVDAIGNIPLFLSFVEDLGKEERRRIILDSIKIATSIAVLFMLGGKLILRFLGITIADFQIAGGALLFVIAIRLLLPSSAKALPYNGHDKDLGVFPLGIPLITGPAVLTTTLMMLDSFGLAPTFVALILNMLFVWFTLVKADAVMKLLGAGGARAFAKIMYILLAAIAVMMIRRGIIGAFLQ
jgi:multiple antibiotic resistance protein